MNSKFNNSTNKCVRHPEPPKVTTSAKKPPKASNVKMIIRTNIYETLDEMLDDKYITETCDMLAKVIDYGKNEHGYYVTKQLD